MKIRTQETGQYYETWEYEIKELPDQFDNWNREDQFKWLQMNCIDAKTLHSEPSMLGTIDEYEIVV